MNYLFISIIFFLAGIGTELLGFGISTISMSLLPFIQPLSSAMPLVAVISVVATGIVAYRTKTEGLSEYLKPLFIGSLISAPLGLIFIGLVDEKVLSITLGSILVLSACYRLIIRKQLPIVNKLPKSLIGFVIGFFGAAINVNGPLLAMFPPKGLELSKEKRKDLIATYLFSTGIVVVTGHLLIGNISKEIIIYTLYSIPALLVGILVGENLFKRIKNKTLKWIVSLFVLAAGIKLLF